MAIRRYEAVDLTVACAMIGRYLSHMDDYLAEKAGRRRAGAELGC